MPPTFTGRVLALALIAALALAPPGCRERNQGTVKVLVIGDRPRVVDPAARPLDPGDSALLSSVAQGLVRFDAGGQIVPGLAERWNVSDDGLSYIFRIAAAQWPNGGKVTAQQVARILKRAIGPASKNPLKDTLGAVQDIVPMTDRVIEIRLAAPRPNLLPLLAQPEFAILRSGWGTGPFQVAGERGPAGELKLERQVLAPDGEGSRRDEVLLDGAAVDSAVKAYAAGQADLVLGGTFADLPRAQSLKLPRGSLRFDPAMGLFGLVPVRAQGMLADTEFRRLLAQSVDRDALVDAMRVNGLAPRGTLLEPNLEGIPNPAPPAWLAIPLADRLPALLATARGMFGDNLRPTLRVALPAGPGADLLFNRLAADWGALGIIVERSKSPAAADLKLVDAVAPSTSPAWFLRQFRCGIAAVCDPVADTLLDAARGTLVPAQRSALFVETAERVDEAQLFIPLAAPVRWSLVSGRIEGFAGNRYARHTLTDLDQKTGGRR